MKEISEVRSAISDGIRTKIIKSLTPKENFKRKFDFSQSTGNKIKTHKVETVIYSNSSDSDSEDCDKIFDNISFKPIIKKTPTVKNDAPKKAPQKRISRGSFNNISSRKASTNNISNEI